MKRVAMAVTLIAAFYGALSTRAGEPKGFPDAKFMQEAASGGMLEVKLGGLTAERSQNGDVREFGKRLVADHSKANTELMDLAKRKGVFIAKELNKTHQGHYDKFYNMKSGPEFDRAIIKHMVKDHEEDAAEFAKQ